MRTVLTLILESPIFDELELEFTLSYYYCGPTPGGHLWVSPPPARRPPLRRRDLARYATRDTGAEPLPRRG